MEPVPTVQACDEDPDTTQRPRLEDLDRDSTEHRIHELEHHQGSLQARNADLIAELIVVGDELAALRLHREVLRAGGV